MWDEIGMSRDYPMKELTRARGYYTIPAAQGIYSLLAGLHHSKAHLLVGLKDGNRQIGKYIGAGSPLQKMSAYFVARRDQAFTAEFQKSVIPDLFGTTTTCEVVQLEAMPLTEEGAIDKSRIAAMGASPRRTIREAIAPRTEMERRIAAIWQEVFSAPQVTIYDNFFDAGGDSLMAMRLLSRLREVFHVEMPLRRLFEIPTVAELAEAIRTTLAADKTQSPS